ncbi:MAG TPA: outer membrane beta-barrel protein [Bacteroidales bacterium]|nr:outer membrane beta-barrel protein [Bacteroidales bacterium]HOH23054.1 outer membrane beta-barrel protein [Bacteroidales bacterium]HPB57093.1 outer membrane beta-barrel protein [Bacteroidales bacterium]HPZ03216.1 outer membrane beta-barrel protein [Bacteroidales bacterium]HQB74538.1 outer membrane beta-barrel protein [Bacteroidales bacterium]
MKKFFLLTVLSLLVINSFAQSNYAPEPRGYRVLVSVFGGPTIDWLQPKTTDYSRVGIAPGVRVGIPIDINLTDRENFYFSTGLHLKFDHSVIHLPEQYTVFKNDTSSRHFDADADRHFSHLYLTLPTGIKMKVAANSRNIFGFNAGLYHSLYIWGKTFDQFESDKLNKEFSITTSKKDDHYAAMFKESLYAGIGYEYKIKNNLRTYCYMNYVFTFTNFFAPNQLNVYGNAEKALSHGLEFIVGIGL